MSLAMYASDFNNESIENNIIQKKREGMRNKTLKRREPIKPTNNVDVMRKRIQEPDDDDDEESNLSNFQPLHHPSSVGVERMENSMPHNMENGMVERMDAQQQMSPNYHNQPETQKEGFTQLPSEYAKQYYQQYVPYFNQGSDDTSPNGVNKDELLTKLNQIIYLLEEQQDEKTGNVTEELILYSFLGIFIIFIVDSFARVGKYVR
jgi:hypothetical protein